MRTFYDYKTPGHVSFQILIDLDRTLESRSRLYASLFSRKYRKSEIYATGYQGQERRNETLLNIRSISDKRTDAIAPSRSPEVPKSTPSISRYCIKLLIPIRAR